MLAGIAGELRLCGLEIREYRHGPELVEIAVTNPRDMRRGRVSVGYDGLMTWEYSGDFETRAGAEEIRNIVTGIFKDDLKDIRMRPDEEGRRHGR